MKNTIFDPLRKREVALTPEEGVRQSVIQWMHKQRGVPLTLMMSEYSMKYNGLSYRADIVIFDRRCEPLMFIECKAPGVNIGEDVFRQVTRYNIVLKVKYIMVTNGSETYMSQLNTEGDAYDFIKDIPDYQQMLDGAKVIENNE